MKNNLFLLSILLLICSCADDKPELNHHVATHTCKVAVLMEQDELERWERTAQWALNNIAQAQTGMDETVSLELVFKCQDDPDIADYMHQIAQDPTIEAIVGPTTSARAEQMAEELGKRKLFAKPMITPSATRVEYQRRFSNILYVWNMAESDIAQLEVLLSGIATIKDAERKSVMLLTADDEKEGVSNSYAEWFGFIAEEYGLKVDGVYLYSDESELRQYVHQFCGTDWQMANKYIVFNPSDRKSVV